MRRRHRHRRGRHARRRLDHVRERLDPGGTGRPVRRPPAAAGVDGARGDATLPANEPTTLDRERDRRPRRRSRPVLRRRSAAVRGHVGALLVRVPAARRRHRPQHAAGGGDRRREPDDDARAPGHRPALHAAEPEPAAAPEPRSPVALPVPRHRAADAAEHGGAVPGLHRRRHDHGQGREPHRHHAPGEAVARLRVRRDAELPHAARKPAAPDRALRRQRGAGLEDVEDPHDSWASFALRSSARGTTAASAPMGRRPPCDVTFQAHGDRGSQRARRRRGLGPRRGDRPPPARGRRERDDRRPQPASAGARWRPSSARPSSRPT